MSKQGISIIEHFTNILKYLQNIAEEVKNNPNIEEIEKKYELDDLKKGIEIDITQIESMLDETLKKREEDENNTEISDEVREVLLAMHDAAIDIHQHFIDIAQKFIEYTETFNQDILEQIQERINLGVFKLDEFKQINTQLAEILSYKKYEA